MNMNDPRVVKTLRYIDDAFLQLLKDTPFQKITVEMICETALINRSTFYKYYQDKYDLMDKYLEKTLLEFKENIHVDAVMAVHNQIDDETYTELFFSVLNFMKTRQQKYQILWSASLDLSIFEEMTKVVKESIYTSLLQQIKTTPRSAAYCDIYATFFATNMMSMMQWWFANEQTISEADVRLIMHRNMKVGIHKAFQSLV